ncbi:hypothetical protein CRG98_047335 [Punica granatum]|uniref:Uncharacterized protein n=1 Tax=Punica granatum TaxID=22663 RepID=A0A2I0HKK1_PUNGR|nr:hypothetical protein CRG98_047335 [Punica granatum]
MGIYRKQVIEAGSHHACTGMVLIKLAAYCQGDPCHAPLIIKIIFDDFSDVGFIPFYSSTPALTYNVWSISAYTLSSALKHPPSIIDLEPSSSFLLGRGGTLTRSALLAALGHTGSGMSLGYAYACLRACAHPHHTRSSMSSAAKSAPHVSVPPRLSTEDEPGSRSIVEGGCLRARDNV